jgi:hypothetical protein
VTTSSPVLLPGSGDVDAWCIDLDCEGCYFLAQDCGSIGAIWTHHRVTQLTSAKVYV